MDIPACLILSKRCNVIAHLDTSKEAAHMSRSDDGKTRTGLRDWLMVSFTMVIPLAWVGTQAAD